VPEATRPFGEGPEPADIVELTLPARVGLLTLPRMTVAAIAADADFDIEEIEDLRLAIEELCLSVVPTDGLGRIALRYAYEAGRLEVSCTYVGIAPSTSTSTTRPEGVAELSERLLDALVDEHGRDTAPEGTRAWLRKARATAPNG
jgi:serine/threonine-protein kinase RsbW